MIQSLIWKEWREQQWKIFYISILMVSANVIGLKTRLMPDEEIMCISVFIGTFFLPIFIGMGLFATEHEERSLSVLLALPVQRWIIFVIKMGIGILACAIPFGISLASALIMAGTREVLWSRVLLLHGCGLGCGLSLLVWMVAFGIRQPSEARAGLVGLAILGGWFLLLVGEQIPRSVSGSGYKLSPVYWFELMDHQNMDKLRVPVIQGVLAALLLIWAMRRFVKIERRSS